MNILKPSIFAAAALLCAASVPASAFPLGAGVGDTPSAVQRVWWDRYGEWHNGYRRFPPPPRFFDDGPPPPPEDAFDGDGPPPPPPPWRRHRCHITPWGERDCRW